ncbi:MAG: TonB-dependent receptor [Acidobacteriaceae bacterium]|nr:TonB-dependent receptor [Acidobacteriaceae bacterium]
MSSTRLHYYIFLPFLLTASLYAQSYQGSVRGTVTDAQGASVTNVAVRLTDQATNESRSTITSSAGEYVFSAVDPATYSLTAESPNFKKFVRRDLIVPTQQTVTADVTLELGSTTQTVEVKEELPLLENSDASNGQVLDSQKMTDLPNLGRNPFLLSKLSTNVVPVGDPRFNRFQDQSGSSAISIAGGPIRGNNYLIDGVPVTDSVNRAVIIPSIEGTQEMKLQENTYDATMGRTGGGVFNTLLRSGSNQFHGSLLGYTRQTDWLANGFFYNASGKAKPDQPFYNWGASVGGPVVIPKVYNGKDKTFFYLTTESYRQKSPLTDGYTLPTAAERAGNFSASKNIIYDPLTSRACTAADNCPANVSVVRTPFAGNIIPSTRINPIGQNVLRDLPAPQTGVVDGVNFTGADTLTDRADEYMAKLDHELFSWWKMNASYLHYKSREPGGNTLGSVLAASNGSPYLLYRKVDATQVNSIMTPNPTTVLSLRFGFNRFPNITAPYSLGTSPATLGFPSNYVSALQAQYLPEFDFSSNSNNFSNVSPSNTVFYSRNFLASLSKFVGRHNFTFGFDYRAIHTDFLNLSNTAGLFAFNGIFTQQYPTKTNNTGLDFADALLGYPASGSVNTSTKLYTHVNYWAGYIQDDYRVTDKLTLNLGLRYEFETGIYEDNDNWVVGFDRFTTNPIAGSVTGITPKGVIQYARTNGNGSMCCNPSVTKFGPRIGFAYQLNPKTTLRGGSGIFYAPTRFADDPSLALGYTQTTNYVASNDGNATPANSLSNPFPSGILQPVGKSQGALTGLGNSFNFLDQNRSSGIVYQYSLDIQREIYKGVVLELGYIGSRSTHLQTSSTAAGAFNINQVPDQYLSLGSQLGSSVPNLSYRAGGPGFFSSKTVAAAQLLKPFSEYNSVNILTNPSSARYNSMIVKAQKRLSAGLTFLSAFTWSKNTDNEFASGNFFSGSSGSPQDAYNLAAEYSLAVTDTPLRWTNTVSYYLPFGKGKMLLTNANKFTDLAIGGWQVNFTNVYQTGFPLAIYQSTNNNSILGTGVQRPNATGISPEVSGTVESRLNGYINPAAFASAASYTYGNLARTIPYRGPGMKNWDISLFKNFAITERFNAEFRAEALNAFNSPQFPNPNTKFGSSSFGTITNQVNFSRLLQLGVRFAF